MMAKGQAGGMGVPCHLLLWQYCVRACCGGGRHEREVETWGSKATCSMGRSPCVHTYML